MTNNMSTSLTNQVNKQGHLYHLLTFHNLLVSEDDFRSGLLNRQSMPPQTVLLRTTLTRMIIIYVLIVVCVGWVILACILVFLFVSREGLLVV